MRRDRLTFAMMVGMPMMQLCCSATRSTPIPKHLPTAVLAADNEPLRAQLRGGACRTAATSTSSRTVASEARGRTRCCDAGDVQFVVDHPGRFRARAAARRAPGAAGRGRRHRPGGHRQRAWRRSATSARRALAHDLTGPLAHAAARAPPPFELRVHRRYNPEGTHAATTSCPGLIGVILTMTMVMMTALAITRERERGTMENLLATPVRPLEVMVGKIVPYIVVGYVQVGVILVAAQLLFDVPMVGQPACCCSVVLGAVHRRQPGGRLHVLDAGAATSCRRCR